MLTITDYLVQNKDEVTELQEFTMPGGRFVDEKGKAIPFKIKPLSMETFEAIQKKCTTTTGRGKKQTTTFSNTRMSILTVLEGCVEPNFRKTDLLKQLGVQSPEQAVSIVLKPGEIMDLGGEILNLSGFDNDLNEEVEDLKN